MTTYLSLDPGKSTGWCLFTETELIDKGTVPDSVEGFCDWWDDYGWHSEGYENVDEVISERYVPDGSVRGEDGIHSLRIEGVLIRECRGIRPLTWQTRGDKAALINGGEKVRNAWISQHFTTVTQHERDAITHMVVYAKRNLEQFEPLLRSLF